MKLKTLQAALHDLKEQGYVYAHQRDKDALTGFLRAQGVPYGSRPVAPGSIWWRFEYWGMDR